MIRPAILCFLNLRLRRIILFLLAVFCVTTARAQDAVRPSLAGESASEARAQDIDRLPYNLLVGPVRFRVSATVAVEYNDNINFAEQHKQDDVIFHPQVNFDAVWPITQINTLTLDIGIGYSFYVNHSEDNT